MDPVTSIVENVVGLHHPWTSPKVIGSDYPVIVSGDFGRRECGRIVSSLDVSPKSDP